MERIKAAIVLLLCVALLAGCGQMQILDGPGMVNDLPWASFTLTDTEGPQPFSITVTDTDNGYVLSGYCQDAEGKIYRAEGIELFEERAYLVGLALHELEDTDRKDMAISLILTYPDDWQQAKVIEPDMAREIYERFLPHFVALEQE